MPFNTAQLAIWTKKFALPCFRLINSNLQKITATSKGELVLSVYKHNDDRSAVILSMKKGESGIYLTHDKPVTLKQPNSFLQITRKYLQNRKIDKAYATISPICVVIEFKEPSSNFENSTEIQQGPDSLILDLDDKPPRLILAKKYYSLPPRYEAQLSNYFQINETFFESWCEWSEENTKTKKRATFLYPLIGYCPLPDKAKLETINNNVEQTKIFKSNEDPKENQEEFNINSALSYLPTHIRKHSKTRLQFLEGRLTRQKQDMPSEANMERLKKQSEGLKTCLYLWPQGSLVWYVPPQFIEQFALLPVYTIAKGEKPSSILSNIFHEIEILERRKIELKKRIHESESSLIHFEKLLIACAIELKTEIQIYTQNKNNENLTQAKLEKKASDFILSRKQLINISQLCKILVIEPIESEQQKKLFEEKEKRLPYKSFYSSKGQFIRVSRSAADADTMLKSMPSHHYWIHVLTGEGSHVWLEKNKQEKKPAQEAIKEAAILAIHHSKHSKSREADIQFATRADIEKKKNLPPGKVLVRRCQTFHIRYEDEELKKIIEGKNL